MMMELLAPAGGMPQLKAALRFGADAVYGGMKAYGLRAFAGNFDDDELKEAVRLVHAQGKKFYVTLNILPYDDELDGLIFCAQRAHEIGVDAAIVSDLGAFSCLRARVPDLPLHVSTQANVMNVPAAQVFVQMGARRIVLARELSLKRIRQIRDALPETVELEAFVHGAMCMAYSGRCMLSDHLTGRGGNRGACAQPCRWSYHVVEEKRPGEYIEVEADERGTSLFSAYDLNMLSHLPEMERAGITSLKIEGRMKTAYYVASVVSCYRRALDILAQNGEEAYRTALPALQADLEKASHRASNTGFYFGAPQPASGAASFMQTREYIADVLGYENGELLLSLKNRFYVGDELELLCPKGRLPFTVSKITLDETNETVPTVSVAGQRVRIHCPYPAEQGDFISGPNRNHI